MANNILTTIGRVIIRRRWKQDLVFAETVAHVASNNNVFTNSASYMWSPRITWGEFASMTLTFAITGTSAGGTVATLETQIQIYDPISNTYCNLLSSPATLASSIVVPASASNYPLLAYPVTAPFGVVGRIGVSMANTSTTDGNISIMMHLQS